MKRHVSILISCDLDDDENFQLCVAEILQQHAMDLTDPYSETGNQRHGIAWYWDNGKEVTVKWAGNFPKGVGFFARCREQWKVWRDDFAHQETIEGKA